MTPFLPTKYRPIKQQIFLRQNFPSRKRATTMVSPPLPIAVTPAPQPLLVPPPPLIHAVSGALGSAIALLLFYPLERIKVEQQRQLHAHNNNTTAATTVVDPDETIEFTSAKSSNSHKDIDAPQTCSSSLKEAMLGESWSFPTSTAVGASSDDEKFHDAISEVKEKNYTNTTPERQTTIVQCFQMLLRRHQLYSGITPVVTTVAISNFIFFYLNEWFKTRLLRLQGDPSSSSSSATRIRSLLASCFAGIGNVLITNPLWVTNLRITTGTAKYTNLIQELQHTIQQHHGSVQHLWSGTIASLLLVSNPVIQFFIYEELKVWILRRQNNRHVSNTSLQSHNHHHNHLTPIQAFIMGAIAKTIATLLTYPLQVAQSLLRMQNDVQHRHIVEEEEDNAHGTSATSKRQSISAKNIYSSTSDCLIQLYQQKGIAALFTGLRAKLLQTILTAALTFLSYEQIVHALHGTYQSVLLRQHQHHSNRIPT
jgi:solute carrier family 25 (peroxisomal adenine nucleotide transporter), member 17